MRRPNRRPNYLEAEDITNWEETADFIVFKDGADNVAINGDTGAELSRNTDASTVIQAAIDALSSSGIIFIKSGTYDIITSISLDEDNDYVSIIGSGAGDYHDEGATVFTVGAAVTTIAAVGLVGDRIRGLTIKGIKFTNDDGRDATAINIQFGTYTKIINCGFDHIDEEAIKVQSSYGMHIIGCTFYVCGDAGNNKRTVYLITNGGEINSAVVIKDCIFESDEHTSIYCNASDARITDNYFEGDSATRPSVAFLYLYSNEHFVKGNSFADSRANSAIPNIMIIGSHNLITCNNMSGGKYGIDISSGGTPTGNIIIGNAFRNCQDYGIRLSENKPSVCSNNVFIDCGDGANKGAIMDRGKSHITNNTIIDSQENGITLDDASGSVIKNNWILEVGNTGVQVNGIEGIGAEDNNFIMDNVIQDYTGAGITGTGAATIIRNNIGHLTEAEGVTGNVADGGTFAHGLVATPTGCVVSPSLTTEFVSVTGLGAANVTVAIKTDAGAAGTAQPLYWRAWIK